ncbi:MAG: HNH/endonuclease VII fold putative polymorphic toxin, partial [Enterobacter sp.]|nr:HNH/endonuclease VII fold putative polymorphic toxin [Enterobacter sp.]
VFAGKKSAQIREILISESAWEEMTCLFAPSLVPLTDRNGKSILGDDHLPIKTREYTFSRPDGESIVIQDHSPGHIYGPPGTPGNQGPHLNVRPISDTRNGTISGTLEHYPF